MESDLAPGAIGPIFIVIGVVMLAIAWFFYARTRSFLERAVDTTGTVVSFVVTSSSEGGDSYKPVVQFSLGDQVVQFTDSMSSNPPGFEVGESVAVKYDPENPQKARLSTTFRLWFLPGLLGLLGGLFAVLGIVFLVTG